MIVFDNAYAGQQRKRASEAERNTGCTIQRMKGHGTRKACVGREDVIVEISLIKGFIMMFWKGRTMGIA